VQCAQVPCTLKIIIYYKLYILKISYTVTLVYYYFKMFEFHSVQRVPGCNTVVYGVKAYTVRQKRGTRISEATTNSGGKIAQSESNPLLVDVPSTVVGLLVARICGWFLM
jgi:hypothetical protein